MCKAYRWFARFGCVLSLINTSLTIWLLVVATRLALDHVKVKPPGPGASDPEKEYYRDYKNCREIGAAAFIIHIVIDVGGSGSHVLLLLATCKCLVEKNRTRCLIWLVIYMVSQLASFICGIVISGMMSGLGFHFGYLVSFGRLVAPLFVLPYLVQLKSPEGEADSECPSEVLLACVAVG